MPDGPLLVGYDQGYTIKSHTVRVDQDLTDWSEVIAIAGPPMRAVNGKAILPPLTDEQVTTVTEYLRMRGVPHTVFVEMTTQLVSP